MRIVRLFLGVFLVLIGVVGVVLPILPGLLFLFLGLSCLWPSKTKAFLKKARSEWKLWREHQRKP